MSRRNFTQTISVWDHLLNRYRYRQLKALMRLDPVMFWRNQISLLNLTQTWFRFLIWIRILLSIVQKPCYCISYPTVMSQMLFGTFYFRTVRGLICKEFHKVDPINEHTVVHCNNRIRKTGNLCGKNLDRFVTCKEQK